MPVHALEALRKDRILSAPARHSEPLSDSYESESTDRANDEDAMGFWKGFFVAAFLGVAFWGAVAAAVKYL